MATTMPKVQNPKSMNARKITKIRRPSGRKRKPMSFLSLARNGGGSTPASIPMSSRAKAMVKHPSRMARYQLAVIIKTIEQMITRMYITRLPYRMAGQGRTGAAVAVVGGGWWWWWWWWVVVWWWADAGSLDELKWVDARMMPAPAPYLTRPGAGMPLYHSRSGAMPNQTAIINGRLVPIGLPRLLVILARVAIPAMTAAPLLKYTRRQESGATPRHHVPLPPCSERLPTT
mmetsp:Transcript_4217/g.8739  ORF Transcript_4217/g.8739 Transcript_4217/m.8739 type:complete len:231 (-) Transcript_4217:209-901(-)